MHYMLDTNVCIYLMKRRPVSYFEKLELLDAHYTVSLSAIVLAELQYGVANSQYKEHSQINLNKLLKKIDVIAYHERCAYYYGEVRAMLRKSGALIGNNDLLIASHALAEQAILVTNNVSEFQRIEGLKLENWAP